MNESAFLSKSPVKGLKEFDCSYEDNQQLQFKSFLMTALMDYIQNERITQREAAERLGVSQPRISNLIHGRTDLFSTDTLLDFMERIGCHVYDRIKIDILHALHQSRSRTVGSPKMDG